MPAELTVTTSAPPSTIPPAAEHALPVRLNVARRGGILRWAAVSGDFQQRPAAQESVALGLNYQDHHQRGTTVASTVTYLLPVVAIVLGVLVLGESVTATVLAGIGLVLIGVALTRRQVKPATCNSERQLE